MDEQALFLNVERMIKECTKRPHFLIVDNVNSYIYEYKSSRKATCKCDDCKSPACKFVSNKYTDNQSVIDAYSWYLKEKQHNKEIALSPNLTEEILTDNYEKIDALLLSAAGDVFEAFGAFTAGINMNEDSVPVNHDSCVEGINFSDEDPDNLNDQIGEPSELSGVFVGDDLNIAGNTFSILEIEPEVTIEENEVEDDDIFDVNEDDTREENLSEDDDIFSFKDGIISMGDEGKENEILQVRDHTGEVVSIKKAAGRPKGKKNKKRKV